jgi:hypothetical protein
MRIDITQYGAVGDGRTVNTACIQEAADDARLNRSGLVIPAGIFVTGTVNLTGVSLRLEKGAVLKGSPDINDYPPQEFIHNEMGAVRALLVWYESEHITIDGEGVIDLNGGSFYDFTKPLIPAGRRAFTERQKAECTVYHESRPNQCLFFHKVSHMTVRDITILDAPCWTVTFNECRDVRALNLTIDTSLNIPNDDGLHFCSCDGVIITGCNISSGDDCLAFSGITNWEKPCENIVVSDCILRSCSKAVSLGYVHSHVRNVLLENIIIKESNRGLCIMSHPKTGLVEHVRAVNMMIETRVRAGNWWGNGEAVFFMACEHDHHIPEEQRPSRSRDINIQNITLTGITCLTENALGIIGRKHNIDMITLKDFYIKRKDSDNLCLKGDVFDVSPSRLTYEVPDDCGLYIEEAGRVSASGIYIEPYKGKNQLTVAKHVIGPILPG